MTVTRICNRGDVPKLAIRKAVVRRDNLKNIVYR